MSGGEAWFVRLNLGGWASSLLLSLFRFVSTALLKVGWCLVVSMVLAVSMILCVHDPCCVHYPFYFRFSTAPSKVGRFRCCFPWGFSPQGKLFFFSSGFCPPREAGAASMMPRSPAGCCSGFRPPREAGAADVAALSNGLFLK